MAMAMAMTASALACASATPPPPSSSSSSSSAFPSSLPNAPSTSSHAPRQARFPNPSLPVTQSAISHDPSLAFANLLWFKGSYNAQIFVGETEPADSIVKRFRRAVIQAGVISECRRRRFHETPQDIAKRKKQAAQRRKSRRTFPRPFFDQKKDPTSKAAAAIDDADNWEYEGMSEA